MVWSILIELIELEKIAVANGGEGELYLYLAIGVFPSSLLFLVPVFFLSVSFGRFFDFSGRSSVSVGGGDPSAQT